MTKRLLAIALVVLVAVSCVYLPSVVASAAEGDVFVANADEYNKSLVEVSFKLGQYRTETVKVPAGVVANADKLLKWANDNKADLGLTDTISALTPVEGQENVYTVETTKVIKVTFKGYKTGDGLVALADPIEVTVGTPVSEVLAKAPAVPAFPGKIFMNWEAFGSGKLDNNGDGLVDDGGDREVVAQYGTYSTGTKMNFYAVKSSDFSSQTKADAEALLNGTKINTYVNATTGTVENATLYDGKQEVTIPYGANPYDYLPAAAASADIANKNAVKVDALAANTNVHATNTYVFDKWRMVNTDQTGVVQFVAVYKVAPVDGTITYTFDVNEEETAAPESGIPNDVNVKSNTLTVDPADVINQDVKDAIAKYEETKSKVFKKWTVTNVSDSAITFKAEYTTVEPYTFYYLDEEGFVTKSTAKYASAAEALLANAPAVADGYTFTKWVLGDATNNVINSMYVEGADDSELPAAKDGPASFKMAESLAPDYFGEGVAPTVGKTVTLKVTGAAATFDTAVEDVNEAIKVNFTGINCDVTSEGNVATVTLTGEGTAYVVATISYQGDVYTKTFTVTGIK